MPRPSARTYVGDSDVPTGALAVRVGPTGQPFYEATWRDDGRRMKRRIGPAWITAAPGGGWQRARGRVPDGYFDEKRAIQAMRDVIADTRLEKLESQERDAEARAATRSFRALAHEWLEHLERVERCKPSTLTDYRSMLAEPNTPRRRGEGVCRARIMVVLGDLPAAAVTPRDVERVLRAVENDGATPRTVNKYRATVRAIYNFGLRYHADSYRLDVNPAAATAVRREEGPGRLEVFSVEEVEELAREAASGRWRSRVPDGSDGRRRSAAWQRSAETLATEQAENEQLAETLRLAAYTGLRRGELVALRWKDVHWSERVLAVQRARSGRIETSTKGRRVRYVPLADQALGALDRLSKRAAFVGTDDHIFCNPAGDPIDPTALRRRYIAARDSAKLPALRFHDLRHTAGTLLARHLDPVTVKDILGHADLKTTERYLHAVRASALTGAVTAAFQPRGEGANERLKTSSF